MNQSKKSIIIAGASGPAGRSTALALLKKGMNVTLVTSSSKNIASLESEFSEYTSQLRIMLGDVSDYSAMKSIREELTGQGVTIIGFVNLIGGWQSTPIGLIESSYVDWLNKRLVDTVASSINAFAEDLRHNSGVYVLVSSPAAEHPARDSGAYAAAKAAAESWVRSLSLYFEGSSARANTLVVHSLVSDKDRAEYPDRKFSNATDTNTLGDQISDLWAHPLENGSRSCL